MAKPTATATSKPKGQTPAADKALKARKANEKGTNGVAKRKIRTTSTFHRPKTLALPRAPKYPRRSAQRTNALDAYAIIKHPLTSESAMKLIEDTNTLVFITDVRANKAQIKDAVHSLYDIKAARINTLVRPDGFKKAYVKLAADQEALEIANKIGII
ncbi:ribosomal protein L23a [Capsaspora owczarzaki ATCC 30864]|uniref:Ribosomal protein L23a n=1 Tax=Capsaspora owczarzaki (strain ATCC 30864) TaxID=595528 RepID=A0A0D2X1D9_CAPO3|nr:ribosomal protein L23a [Capsaspora owczarzaki ATCC 30864]KJE90639.1 ribosomal protein L23a [Capsaspora owczarzaki ATCC 30864]|eukprot:XP_004364786.1 ribosomal protein L23a [Capsaspora owczarzaki ATCC 30864]